MPFKSQQQRRWMYATHPRMAKRWERETPEGPLPRKVREAGNGSGRYTGAFTHPDSLDPNDAQRQRTQARSISFPYDQPVGYGQPESPDDAGARYQDGGYGGQLTPWFVKDDGDIEKEASETPYSFGQSDRGAGGAGGLTVPGQSRGFAGSTKDDLDLPHQETFGEDLRDLQTGGLRDISGYGAGMAGAGWDQVQTQPAPTLEDELVRWEGFDVDEDLWPEHVRGNQLRSLENHSLAECFAVYNEESDEVVSLLETLDWEG